MSRWLLFLVIGSLVAGGLLAAGILLFGSFGEVEEKIVGTTFWLGVTSFLGLASSIRIARRQVAWLGVAGMAAATASFVLTTLVMWAEIESQAIGKVTMSATLAAASSAFASVLLIVRPATPQVRWILTATLGLLVVAVGMAEFLVLWAPKDPSEGEVFFRILGATAILAALGAILTPILDWALRRRPA